MTQIAQGAHVYLFPEPGQVYRVQADDVATVQVLYGAPSAVITLAAQSQTFGPYDSPAKLKVTANTAPAEYTLLRAHYVELTQAQIDGGAVGALASDDAGGVIEPDGDVPTLGGSVTLPAMQTAFDAGTAPEKAAFQASVSGDRVAEITPVAVQKFCIFAEMGAGTFYGAQESSAGGWGGRVVVISGNITTTPTIVGLTATDTSGLYDLDGVTLIGGATILNVWPLTTTMFIFAVRTGGGKCYLYKARYISGSWVVGTNSPTFSNKTAIARIGDLGGVHTAEIIALHQRSLCIANINGSRRLIFGEYNIASGRVAGGANDQVRIWQSADDGDTWTALLTFNSAGTRHVNHCHGVVQNPYDRSVWVCMGDIGLGGVIRWDGTSPAPAANSTYAQIAATPGWTAFWGQSIYTTGDIMFGPGRAFWMPDADALTAGANGIIEADYKLSYAYPGPDYERYDMLPPLIFCSRRSDDVYVAASLIASNSAEAFFHLWTSKGGRNWSLVAKIRQYAVDGSGRPVIATISNMFFDSSGRLIVSGVNGRAARLAPLPNSNMACVICGVSAPTKYISGPAVLN